MTPRRNGARRSWRWRPSSGATSPPICRHSSTRPWIVSNPHSPRTTDMSDTQSRAVTHAFWPVVLLAASVLMITMGARQSLGLFVSPLNTATGLGIASISLAMAVGQFLFAPLLKKLIGMFGGMAAMWSRAVISLFTLPMAWLLRKRPAAKGSGAAHAPTPNAHSGSGAASGQIGHDGGIKKAIRIALADRSYLLLHAGFFTCGFHIAFLVTHLPGEVQLCGLPPNVASWSLAIIGLANIVVSLSAAWVTSRYRSKYILAAMYASRAVLILVYLLAPKTETTFYLFAAGLGLTWLATVPPTAGIVGKLYGTRYLSTLFGLTLLSHQVGGFFGAWLGGIAITRQGNYDWMWYADIALASLAALCNLPIREAPIVRLGALKTAAAE